MTEDTSVLNLVAWILSGAAMLLVLRVAYGPRRWGRRTEWLYARLDAQRISPSPSHPEPAELEGLPAPVQRYLRSALGSGRPRVTTVSMIHTGRFNISPDGERWKPFESTQIDGPLAATLLFRFDETGLVTSVRAEARGRMVNGKAVPTPWEGRWWRYTVHDGLRVPLEGEVAWLLPSGRQPYWRGRVTQLSYGFAGADRSSTAA